MGAVTNVLLSVANACLVLSVMTKKIGGLACLGANKEAVEGFGDDRKL